MQKAIQTLIPSWKNRLSKEWNKPHMQELDLFLKEQKSKKREVYPSEKDYFTAFNLTSFDQVKVVILGQDPYHGEGQAHGLSFSVPPQMKIPPSLVNIYKELKSDLDVKAFASGDLSGWAQQGVLLLNATLSVEARIAGSHQKKGWEEFTDSVIEILNQHRENLVFMLWGSYAQKKGAQIDQDRHLVLKAPHPSPLSAYRGFLGCRHFSKANQFLSKMGLAPIDWSKNSTKP